MSPKDPVQQATPRRLGRLVPVQVRGPRSLRPEYVKVTEALRLDHLQQRRKKQEGKKKQTQKSKRHTDRHR